MPAWWALWLLWWPLTDAAMFQCVYGYLQNAFFFLVLFHYCILLVIKLTTTNVFLKTGEQRVEVSGAFSSPTSVHSGVPQGTVLGALLSLLHINDLPQVVTSQVRLFADDCLLYQGIRYREDQIVLQRDLTTASGVGGTPGVAWSLMQTSVISCVSLARRPPIPSFIALTTRSKPGSTRLNISGSHYTTS